MASEQRIGLITKVTNEKNVRKREEIALASHHQRVKERTVDAKVTSPLTELACASRHRQVRAWTFCYSMDAYLFEVKTLESLEVYAFFVLKLRENSNCYSNSGSLPLHIRPIFLINPLIIVYAPK